MYLVEDIQVIFGKSEQQSLQIHSLNRFINIVNNYLLQLLHVFLAISLHHPHHYRVLPHQIVEILLPVF